MARQEGAGGTSRQQADGLGFRSQPGHMLSHVKSDDIGAGLPGPGEVAH